MQIGMVNRSVAEIELLLAFFLLISRVGTIPKRVGNGGKIATAGPCRDGKKADRKQHDDNIPHHPRRSQTSTFLPTASLRENAGLRQKHEETGCHTNGHRTEISEHKTPEMGATYCAGNKI